MSVKKKKKPDPRLKLIAEIARLRFRDGWVADIAVRINRSRVGLYAIVRGGRGLTDEVYGLIMAVLDAELDEMQADVEKARAIRAKLK